ncbi:hypothetical protein BKA70DRAFT_1397411 [Coprinopsis sp. MPI-PUGE-AT-0042]|nr:hypothetical protein BKA70DRAFT_1397411 [Coprinopsis sp. MPI-PUGE-AT-0042]
MSFGEEVFSLRRDRRLAWGGEDVRVSGCWGSGGALALTLSTKGSDTDASFGIMGGGGVVNLTDLGSIFAERFGISRIYRTRGLAGIEPGVRRADMITFSFESDDDMEGSSTSSSSGGGTRPAPHKEVVPISPIQTQPVLLIPNLRYCKTLKVCRKLDLRCDTVTHVELGRVRLSGTMGNRVSACRDEAPPTGEALDLVFVVGDKPDDVIESGWNDHIATVKMAFIDALTGSSSSLAHGGISPRTRVEAGGYGKNVKPEQKTARRAER